MGIEIMVLQYDRETKSPESARQKNWRKSKLEYQNIKIKVV